MERLRKLPQKVCEVSRYWLTPGGLVMRTYAVCVGLFDEERGEWILLATLRHGRG